MDRTEDTDLITSLEAIQKHIRFVLALHQAQPVGNDIRILALSEIDPAQAMQAHEQPGLLFEYGSGGKLYGGFSSDRQQFVLVPHSMVVLRRREVLALIIQDYLGDTPAQALLSESERAANAKGKKRKNGGYLFGSRKLHPHHLSNTALQHMVEYFEGADENKWYYQYYLMADTMSRRVAHWLSWAAEAGHE